MGRRRKNMPAIWFDSKDQRWHCQPTVGVKDNGKPDRRHIKRKTEAAVIDAVEDLFERTKAAGKAPPTTAMTVEQWLRHWLENIVKPKKRPKTYGGYKSLVERHIIPSIGQWRIDGNRKRLEPDHLDTMYAAMQDPKRSKTGRALADTTVVKAHAVLSKALGTAKKRGRATRNVCDLVDKPTAQARRIVGYDVDDAQLLLRAAADDPLSARWLIGLLLGPRQGEALGLRWPRLKLTASTPHMLIETQVQRHVWEHGCNDPEACALTRCKTKPCGPSWLHGCPEPEACRSKAQPRHCPARRQTKCKRHTRPCPAPCRKGCVGHASTCPQRVNGGLREVEVKSEKAERPIPLPPAVVAALEARRQQQMQEANDRKVRWDDQGLVFTRPDGRAIDPKDDWLAWKALIRRAGVPDGRLHAARHTAASLLTAMSSIEVAQELLGHADVRTTRGYVDVAAKAKEKAVARVADLLLSGNLAQLLKGQSAGAESG